MTTENLSQAELESLAGRELTDAELEAIAAGKGILSKIDPSGSYGPGNRGFGMFASNNRRSLPGRGGRLASNVRNSGQAHA
jgi:hypothetical protein